MTVTERDGIEITAQGGEDQNKTLTFQYDGLWYQISCSKNDSYESLEELLEWFWKHPLDLILLNMEINPSPVSGSPPVRWQGFPDFEIFSKPL